jgi:hypothetical protein
MGLSALPADFCLHNKLPFVYTARECECAGNAFQCEAVPPEAGTAGCTCGGFSCKGDGTHAFHQAQRKRRAKLGQEGGSINFDGGEGCPGDQRGGVGYI